MNKYLVFQKDKYIHDTFFFTTNSVGDMKKLRNIQIITNTFTECVAPPVDYRIWKKCRKANPKLRVHLITEGKHKNEMTFQQRAPVKSIVYDSPYIPVSIIITMTEKKMKLVTI